MLFRKYFLEALNPRKLQGSTGMQRDRQNLLADYDRADPKYPQILNRLKNSDTGKFPVNRVTLSQIQKIFNITDFSRPRKLGNTGITLSSENGKYYISK